MRHVTLSALLALACLAAPTFAQDNPRLNAFLNAKIKEELSKKHDPNTGYRDGPHWVHIDHPGKTLSVDTKTTLTGGRATLDGKAAARLAFNYRVTIEKTVFGKRIVFARHDFGGYADVALHLEASANLGPQLSGSKVSIKQIKVSNLRMRSDAAKPFEGLIESWVNAELGGRRGELERTLADALNTVKP